MHPSKDTLMRSPKHKAPPEFVKAQFKWVRDWADLYIKRHPEDFDAMQRFKDYLKHCERTYSLSRPARGED